MLRSIKKFYQTYSDHTLFIIACFILFWPLAMYILWRHKKLSFRTCTIVTLVLMGLTLLIGIIGYNAPPYISLSNESLATDYKTDNGYVEIAGQITMLHNPNLIINGKSVTLSKYGNFTYMLALAEGDTNVRIMAKSDKGSDTRQFKVHRTTVAEFTQRNLIAEKEAADKKRVAEARALKAKQDRLKSMPTCNGTSIKAQCALEGVIYKTYVYHPAVAEKNHTETVTSYREEVSGYCTLCVDGSYSPTCATGSGACSHHGGVAQWNAPQMRNVPVYSLTVVVDAPAQTEFYEKVTE